LAVGFLFLFPKLGGASTPPFLDLLVTFLRHPMSGSIAVHRFTRFRMKRAARFLKDLLTMEKPIAALFSKHLHYRP
jgi:hypothetical protein